MKAFGYGAGVRMKHLTAPLLSIIGSYLKNLKPGTMKHAKQIAVLRILIAILAVVTAIAGLALLNIYMSTPRVPPKIPQDQLPAGKHRVDLHLIDAPEIKSEEIEAMLQPLGWVAELRMPGTSQQFRILASPEGFPYGYAGSGIGAAGYVSEHDLFVVDVQAVRGMLPALNSAQRWALVMGHEATHLWQMRRGSLILHSSNMGNHEAYRTDPIEIEAYTEGVTLVSAISGEPFIYTRSDGSAFFPPLNNPYKEIVQSRLTDTLEVHITTQTTPVGLLRALRAKFYAGIKLL
jgi:hypothetical protein